MDEAVEEEGVEEVADGVDSVGEAEAVVEASVVVVEEEEEEEVSEVFINWKYSYRNLRKKMWLVLSD